LNNFKVWTVFKIDHYFKFERFTNLKKKEKEKMNIKQEKE
jgi:hypothetical protein